MSDLPSPEPRVAKTDELDRDLKATELAIKKLELSKAERAAWWRDLNPVVVGILAALVGFISNIAATAFQGYNALKVEREKLQGSLIVEYVKTGDPDVARQNLEFLLRTGILRDPEAKIDQYLKSKQDVPVLPAFERIIGQAVETLPDDDVVRRAARPVGRIASADGRACTGFLITSDFFLTADFCVSQSEQMNVTFGYQSKDSKEQVFPVERVAEVNAAIGYAIVRVRGTPGATLGFLKYRSTQGKILIAESVSLVHHNQTSPLVVTRCAVAMITGNYVHYDCGSGAGASGAPLLDSTGEVVAIHRADTEGGLKEGTLMSSIARNSSVIRAKTK